MDLTLAFSSVLWEHGGDSSWVFVTVPPTESDEIADAVVRRPGFGSVKVTATIGATQWSTSLFPSKELGSYVLPVKRAVRDREQLDVGDVAGVTIRVDVSVIA